MKSLFALIVSLAMFAAVGASPAGAQDAYANVDTPTSHYVFTGCTFSDVFFNRVGTVATVYADCTGQAALPQTKGWEPLEHPDGGVLWWDSRLRFSESAIFQNCTVRDYGRTAGLELLIAECMDDPLVPPPFRSRAPRR